MKNNILVFCENNRRWANPSPILFVNFKNKEYIFKLFYEDAKEEV